jgi:hypothetical protein
MVASVGNASVPFLVQGTASDPVFRPDVRSAVSEGAKTYGVKAATGLLKGLLGGKK